MTNNQQATCVHIHLQTLCTKAHCFHISYFMNKVLFGINTCTQTQSEPFVLQTPTVQACPYSLMWFSCESVQHVVITTACVHMSASFFHCICVKLRRLMLKYLLCQQV